MCIVFMWNVFPIRKYTLKYLRMKRHDIYNLHANDSEKNIEECIYTHMEREREQWSNMLTISKSEWRYTRVLHAILAMFCNFEAI